MNQKYLVVLTEAERYQLKQLLASGNSNARKLRRAQILLKSDSNQGGPNWSYQAICEAFDVSQPTITEVRQAYVEGGVEAAIHRKKPDRVYERRLDGDSEAHLVMLVGGKPPTGYERWTLRLLKIRMIKLEYVENVSHETIGTTLKKNELKPWLKEQWCIPAKAHAEFVSCMENVLDVYQRTYDPQRPQVCMDETSKQLLADVQPSIPMQPGQPERYDYEYEREGVANLFLFVEPLAGQRHVKVTDRRTKVDWAQAMRDLSDVYYPEAEVIVVVLDILNTLSPASFYEALEPAEAHRLARRFEFHYTPKHGSWLNMAEIELSALGRQCLARRIPDKTCLISEASAWEEVRNASVVKVLWRFTTADARIKLAHLYPRIQL